MFKGEFISVQDAGLISPTDQVIHYQLQNSKAHQGYRYDKVLEVITENIRGEDSFSGVMATLLFLDLYWNEMILGSNEGGEYVDWGSRRFYKSGRIENTALTTHPSIDDQEAKVEGTGANWYVGCKTGGLIFNVHVPTLIFLLFHNTTKLNPYEVPGIGVLHRSKGKIKWEKSSSYSVSHMVLLNNLRFYNLLTEGIPSADWLRSMEDTGFTFSMGRVTFG